MALRPPSLYGGQADASGSGFDLLGHEILAEKAAVLGRTGAEAELRLARLGAHDGTPAEREALVRAAAEAVHAWFIQRELCGFRRHDDVIRQFAIPKAVLARLGAK